MSTLSYLPSRPGTARRRTSAAVLAAMAFVAPFTTAEPHGHTPGPPVTAAALLPVPVPYIPAWPALIWLAVVLATRLGPRFRTVPPDRPAHHGLGAAITCALTLLIPWTGLPYLLGVASTTQAIQHSRGQPLTSVPATAAAGNGCHLLTHPTRLTN